MKQLIYILPIILIFSSCFKEEEKRKAENTAYESIKIEADYSRQVFYNLNSKTIISQNNWADWDLAFYSQDDDYYIKLNAAASMKIANTKSNDFNANINIADLDFKIDDPKSNINRAIDVYFNYVQYDTLYSDSMVYVLFLGMKSNGDSLGFRKIVFDYAYKNQYHIKYSNLDGSNLLQTTIIKNPTTNFTSFSLNKEEIVEIEPDKSTWDLLFSLSTDAVYTDDFSDTILDYAVTSVLLNPYTTEAYLEENISFDNFNLLNIDENKFSKNLNIIGYNWKRYQISQGNSGTYSIYPNKIYIVKGGNGLIYKMKFISFIDPETNERGTISFQYEVLK